MNLNSHQQRQQSRKLYYKKIVVPVSGVTKWTEKSRYTALAWSTMLPNMLTLAVQTAVLEMEGASQVKMNGATLSCMADSVAAMGWKYVASRDHETARVVLSNVPVDCSGRSIQEPCASVDPQYPALFGCAFVGPGGARAEKVHLHPNSSVLMDASGYPVERQVWLDCPLPNVTELAAVAPRLMDDGTAEFTLQIIHRVQSSATRIVEKVLPFIGPHQGDALQFSAYSPPSPPLPSSPIPSPPPPAPPPGIPPPSSPYVWVKPTGEADRAALERLRMGCLTIMCLPVHARVAASSAGHKWVWRLRWIMPDTHRERREQRRRAFQ